MKIVESEVNVAILLFEEVIHLLNISINFSSVVQCCFKLSYLLCVSLLDA